MCNDRRLHEEVGMKVSSSRPEGCTVQKVKDLLHQHRVGWNEELLYQLFSEKECLSIQKIPVSSLGLTDKLIWHSTKNGQYSVKSGYKLAKDAEEK